MSMHIRLTDERRERMLRSLQLFSSDKLDWDLSEFQATQLLDFLENELGAPVYNQAIGDALKFMQDKLVDLEAEFYEPEDPYAR